jgi:hypothetical protein
MEAGDRAGMDEHGLRPDGRRRRRRGGIDPGQPPAGHGHAHERRGRGEPRRRAARDGDRSPHAAALPEAAGVLRGPARRGGRARPGGGRDGLGGALVDPPLRGAHRGRPDGAVHRRLGLDLDRPGDQRLSRAAVPALRRERLVRGGRHRRLRPHAPRGLSLDDPRRGGAGHDHPARHGRRRAPGLLRVGARRRGRGDRKLRERAGSHAGRGARLDAAPRPPGRGLHDDRRSRAPAGGLHGGRAAAGRGARAALSRGGGRPVAGEPALDGVAGRARRGGPGGHLAGRARPRRGAGRGRRGGDPRGVRRAPDPLLRRALPRPGGYARGALRGRDRGAHPGGRESATSRSRRRSRGRGARWC